MKKIIGLVTTVLVFSSSSLAQERHTVLSITQEMHEISWYAEQQAIWSSDVKADKTNAEAWYNYYSATRALKNLSEKKETRDAYRKECSKIAEDAYKAIPNTFEGNHLMWWDGNNDKAKRKYLFEAARINPNDTRAYDDLMIVYEIMGDKKMFDAMCDKLYKNSELPSSMMNWGYNVLSELEEDAIVFVRGDNDTYALWITQSVKGFRKDVEIVNTSLMGMDEYREEIFKRLNYNGFTDEHEEIFQFMIDNKRQRPVHVSSSALHSFRETPIMDSLYLVGLTYLYCGQQMDNVSLIKRNYEKRFLLDYLTESFAVHPSDDIARNFDALYIPSMIKLYKHYRDSEEIIKKEEIEALLLKISQQTGQAEEVKNLISHK